MRVSGSQTGGQSQAETTRGFEINLKNVLYVLKIKTELESAFGLFKSCMFKIGTGNAKVLN